MTKLLQTGPVTDLPCLFSWAPDFPFVLPVVLPEGFTTEGAWAKLEVRSGGGTTVLFSQTEADESIVFSEGRLDVSVLPTAVSGATVWEEMWSGYQWLVFSLDIGEASDPDIPLYRLQGRVEKLPPGGSLPPTKKPADIPLDVGGVTIVVNVAARGADGQDGEDGQDAMLDLGASTTLVGIPIGKDGEVAIVSAPELRAALEAETWDATFSSVTATGDLLAQYSANSAERIGFTTGLDFVTLTTGGIARINGVHVLGLSNNRIQLPQTFPLVWNTGGNLAGGLTAAGISLDTSDNSVCVGDGTAGDASGTLRVAQIVGGLISDSDQRGGYIAGGAGVVPEGPNKIQIYLSPSHGGQPQFSFAKAQGSLPNRLTLGRSNGLVWRDSAYSDHAGGGHDTGITRDSAGVIAIGDGTSGNADGDVKMRRAHFGSASLGTATLVNGTITVANTSVTANTLIFLQRSTASGTTGELTSTKSVGTSFTINSDSLTDASTVDYLLLELAS